MKTGREMLEEIGFPRIRDFAIGTDDVHVWSAELDQSSALVRSLRKFLTVHELGRVAHFHLDEHRRRFMVARGLLRVILGCYLNIGAETLRFSYGPYGKPALASDDSLNFSLSHSDGLALLAFARERRIGIDLEHIRTDIRYQQIAKRFFSVGENAELMSLRPDIRLEAFFACWTRKEAYLKATGEGLAHSLSRIVVSCAPDEPVEILEINEDPDLAGLWSLRHLTPRSDYIAALAVEGHEWELSHWSAAQMNPI